MSERDIVERLQERAVDRQSQPGEYPCYFVPADALSGKAADVITTLRADLSAAVLRATRAEERAGRLEAALRPFAEAWQRFFDDVDGVVDDDCVWADELPVPQWRAAAAALATPLVEDTMARTKSEKIPEEKMDIVTPRMVEAGLRELSFYHPSEDPTEFAEEVVSSIYLAMRRLDRRSECA